MNDCVRCRDCGFLGIRFKGGRDVVEVEAEIRIDGKFPSEPRTGGSFLVVDAGIYECKPICQMLVPELREDFRNRIKEKENADPFITVINSERNCKQFTPWVPGFSPREHREMLDQKSMREWQERQQERLEQREDRRDHEQRIWRTEDKRWRLIELVVMGAVVTLISGIVQIIAALIQRG